MEEKELMKYSEWLMLTKGKIEPNVGDKVIVNFKETTVEKSDLYSLKQEFKELGDFDGIYVKKSAQK